MSIIVKSSKNIQRGKVCFCHEIFKRELKYRRQVSIPIIYDEIKFDEGLRLDVLVEELIICSPRRMQAINGVN